MTETAGPIKTQERFHSLDFIRGFAIMGILAINIQAFGNLFSSYTNPTINGDFTGVNVVTWFATHIFIEQKFYTIFSMLFGAGIVVMASRAVDKGISAAKIHYKRNFWLLVFGLTHGFMIWFGDILNTYAVFSMLFFFMWDKSPKTQIIVGLSLVSLLGVMMGLGSQHMQPADIENMEQMFYPAQEVIDHEVAGYLGSWSENQAVRVENMQMMLSNLLFAGIRISGCMFIGMALFKLGILNGQRSVGYYKKMTLIFLIPGLALVATGAILINSHGYQDAVYTMMVLGQFNYFGSLIMAIGYIGLFNYLYLKGVFGAFGERIEAVGRMAFTNYITQSIICTTIFYGFGFGLFGSLERVEMLGVVFAVWVLQLGWSKWWLDKYNYGPLEWLWRTLTYGKVQTMKK